MSACATTALAEAIREQRPLVLFAGQDFDYAGSHCRSVLDAFLDRLSQHACTTGWHTVLNFKTTREDMEWLSERFDRSVLSDASLRIVDMPWSAVFTSSINPQLARNFETRGRQPEQVLSREVYSRVSRSRSRPPIHYIFGKSDETDIDTRAPRTRVEWKRRLRRHAGNLINRIGETATARGVVVISGYDPNSDWLPIDDILAPLSDHSGLQVLWFGNSTDSDSDVAEEMVAHGMLTITETTLATAIGTLELDDSLDIAGSVAPDEPGMVSINGTVLDITPALRLRVEASAAIVDDAWSEEPDLLQESQLQDAFRRFHGGIGNFRVLVEGVARGFAVKREFEDLLWRTITQSLDRLGQQGQNDLVLIHGQSGTGKSVAVARLALDIRRRLCLPVLVATNRIPSYSDIEAFCSAAEQVGARATVLICDASQAPERYEDLGSAMRSKGRRILIVGTAYRMDWIDDQPSVKFVEAPAYVTDREGAALEGLVTEFGHSTSIIKPESSDGSNIFAMIYRKLPEGRGNLASGVSAEARAVEQLVRTRAKAMPRPVELSPLAMQLVEAGVVSPTTQFFRENEQLEDEGLDAAGRLIDYVMVAGRLNCPVPLNLIFRVITAGKAITDLSQVLHMFKNLDLFRWRETGVEGSDPLIAPRIQLEAELICRRRIADAQLEIKRLIELIDGVRLGLDRKSERSFLLDLLQKLDRNGPLGSKYSSGYLQFAEALRRLRTHHGVLDPTLMLRECVFRRQAVYAYSSLYHTNEESGDRRLEILDSARATVEEALRLIEGIDGNRIGASKRTRQNLLAERSAIYGYLAVQRARSTDSEECWADYLAARAASDKAVAITEDYHPIDIALWTASDVLKDADLSNERRAEVLADVKSTLELAEESMVVRLSPRKFLKRRVRVAQSMDDKDLSAVALRELEKVAPAAATFLIARDRAKAIYESEPPFDANIRSIAANVADFLSERSRQLTSTTSDPRCQRLLLRLRWAQATGERLLWIQRGRTPSDPSLTSELLSIVSAINEGSGLVARNQERFLEAVLAWLTRDTSRAIDIWRSLSGDTEYEDRSRVIRQLLITDRDGSPVAYHGRILNQIGTNSWRIKVREFDRPIVLLAREFKDEELARGREVRGFGIAFNYIGPIADPLSRTGFQR